MSENKCVCKEPYDSERHEGGYPYCPVHDAHVDTPLSPERDLILRIVEQWGNAMQMDNMEQWLRDYAAKRQPGSVWVKASERLPGWGVYVKWRYDGTESTRFASLRAMLNNPNYSLYNWEWYDESPAEQPVTKWIAGALQWAKETIDFAWDYVKVPESLVETWGNMYMNTMHAIAQAQQETPAEQPGREVEAVEFARWILENNYKPYAGEWYLNGNHVTHHPRSTNMLYQEFKQPPAEWSGEKEVKS